MANLDGRLAALEAMFQPRQRPESLTDAQRAARIRAILDTEPDSHRGRLLQALLGRTWQRPDNASDFLK